MRTRVVGGVLACAMAVAAAGCGGDAQSVSGGRDIRPPKVVEQDGSFYVYATSEQEGDAKCAALQDSWPSTVPDDGIWIIVGKQAKPEPDFWEAEGEKIACAKL